MKKYLTLLLTLCMVFGLLAGCAEKPAEPSAQTDTTQQDAALTFATSYEQVYKALATAKENTDARNDMNASAAETLTDGSADGGDHGSLPPHGGGDPEKMSGAAFLRAGGCGPVLDRGPAADGGVLRGP